jgi:3-hydroxybutyrate dehydrogenase
MLRPLEGKCALVTGSTQGLGLAAARALAAAGCRVIVHGLGEPPVIDAAMFSAADLRDPEAIAALVRDAAGRFGGIDILVNNAVVRHVAPVEEFDVAHWNEAIAVNLSAAFHTTSVALPYMKHRQWGRIVNVSSIYGLRGAANRVGYVTTKTALIGLTRAVALETVNHGITCNAICPGTTESPVHQDAIERMAAAEMISGEDAERRFLASKQPSGRFIPAASVGALLLFLCSDGAAHITGTALPIDDGWSAA